jgi:hypothetical protein
MKHPGFVWWIRTYTNPVSHPGFKKLLGRQLASCRRSSSSCSVPLLDFAADLRDPFATGLTNCIAITRAWHVALKRTESPAAAVDIFDSGELHFRKLSRSKLEYPQVYQELRA